MDMGQELYLDLENRKLQRKQRRARNERSVTPEKLAAGGAVPSEVHRLLASDDSSEGAAYVLEGARGEE
eukprot:10793085-Karenia_brevis.AAC.1